MVELIALTLLCGTAGTALDIEERRRLPGQRIASPQPSQPPTRRELIGALLATGLLPLLLYGVPLVADCFVPGALQWWRSLSDPLLS